LKRKEGGRSWRKKQRSKVSMSTCRSSSHTKTKGEISLRINTRRDWTSRLNKNKKRSKGRNKNREE
jgi:hypothetical protein